LLGAIFRRLMGPSRPASIGNAVVGAVFLVVCARWKPCDLFDLAEESVFRGMTPCGRCVDGRAVVWYSLQKFKTQGRETMP